MKLPIPITVLTGFLGSGKTTLLKSLLHHPEMAGTAVIVNEFGEIGLDEALIEHAKEETVLLPSGCVCCAVRGDLVEALNRLYNQMGTGTIPEISRIVLETSGLADPAPIAHTIMTEEDLFRIYQLDGIVTTVDAELGLTQIDSHFEPAKQIAVADRIVLTKTDRADDIAIAAITSRLQALNPAAGIHSIVLGNTSPDLITGLSAFEPVAAKAHAEGWLGAGAYGGNSPDDHHHGDSCTETHCTDPAHDHHHTHAHPPGHSDQHPDQQSHQHTHGITSFSLTIDKPIDGRKLSFIIDLLRMTHGDKLLRMKAIACVQGEPLPFVIHGVQHIFYPPTTLDRWPGDDHRSRFVFITKDLDKAAVEKIFEPILSDRPVAPEAFATW
ncbi:MAG TPA: GTP-binding protein [Hyphomicrobiaceae bacterium]|nr:GTP-binding protein [Hyphomicrobiaceae bacterium]